MSSQRTVVELTTLCVIYNGDDMLVEEKSWHGEDGVVFPGGHVEAGESFREAVIREMQEETGLTIEDPLLCGVKDWYELDGTRYVVLLYKATKFFGNLVSSDEGKVYWMSREEFNKANVLWSMRETLETIERNDRSEYYSVFDGQEWVGKII